MNDQKGVVETIAKYGLERRVVLVMTYPGALVEEVWREVVRRFEMEGQESFHLDLEVWDVLKVKELDKTIREMIKNKLSKTIVGFFGGERLFDEGKFNLVKWIKEITKEEDWNFVIFVEANLLNNEGMKVLSKVPGLLAKVIAMPVLDKEAISRELDDLNLSEPIKPRIKERIGELGGGIRTLVRALGEMIGNGEVINWHNPLEDVGLRLVVGSVWLDFTDKEREVLRNIVLKPEKVSKRYYFSELDYLESMGIIERREDGSWQLKVDLLKDYIWRTEWGRQELSIIGGRIYFNEKEVNDLFSKKERQVINQLIENKGIVSREQLGEILWEDGDYTDWALDALVARLRKKLRKLNLEKRLETVRGKGWRWMD